MRVPLIHRPEELNRILLLARELEANSAPISEQAIKSLAGSNAIHAELPSYAENIEVAVFLGLLAQGRFGHELTSLGESFIALNPDSTYELAPGQARFLFENCIIQGPYNPTAREFFEPFRRDFARRTFVLDTRYENIQRDRRALISLLRRLGVIAIEDSFLVVTSDYLAEVSLLKSRRQFSLAQLKLLLRDREVRGQAAEEWVLRYEQERLRKAGCEIEAMAVQIISALDVAAGYDIESFNGKSDSLRPDRFVEVKSTSSAQPLFMLSENEYLTALALQKSYWIYLLTAFQSADLLAQLSILRDPAALRARGNLEMNPAGYECRIKD